MMKKRRMSTEYQMTNPECSERTARVSKGRSLLLFVAGTPFIRGVTYAAVMPPSTTKSAPVR